MLAALARHPLPMAATFRHTLVLTYAYPAEVLAGLLAPGLTLDTYDGWGFLAIALVDARHLRPVGFPAALGVNLYLSGYRIFTRFRRPDGRVLRGLQILRSDTDSPWVVRLGNRLTGYRYAPCKAEVQRSSTQLSVRVAAPGADLTVDVDLKNTPEGPPDGSPFPSLIEARRYAGPLPHTFGYDPGARAMIVVRGHRSGWDPRPVSVLAAHASFLDQLPVEGVRPRLANAFLLENVPYRWGRGQVVPLAPEAQP